MFGSRMLDPGSARAGGMPLYKYLGNRVLTTFENRLLDSNLSEFHSGYRAYRVSALAELPLEFNTDDFDFDTQIIIQLLDAGKRIVEVPIPTYYGDEICYVNGLKYARDVARDVVQYRLTKVGIGTHRWVPADPEYAARRVRAPRTPSSPRCWRRMPAGRVLDLGCSGGRLSERIRQLGHKVVGVDSMEIAGVRDRVDDFFLGDLEDGIPEAAGGDFDVVIAADVIEHVRNPERLLRQMAEVLSPNGQIVISTPELRPLVLPWPGRRRRLRLRPAGHPGRDPPAVLLPQEPAPHDRLGRPGPAAAGVHRPAAGGADPDRQLAVPRRPGGGPAAGAAAPDRVRLPVRGPAAPAPCRLRHPPRVSPRR